MGQPPNLTELMYRGSGEFNHRIWQTRPALDASDPFDQLLTLHELSHFELNNVSSAGMILTFFAELANHAGKDRGRYYQILDGLVARSRIAHEVYATWHAVEQLSVAHPRTDLVARLPSEYSTYLSIGERLVSGIESPFLRQQAFLTIMRACFEATTFGDFNPSEIETFRLGQIRSRDYPDSRLDYLSAHCPAALFAESSADFCRTYADRETVALIEGALSAEKHQGFFERYSPEADRATLRFLERLYGDLSLFLKHHLRPINPFGHHLSLAKALTDAANHLCGNDAMFRQLSVADSPHDAVSMLLRQMENEVYWVKDAPMPVAARPLSSLPLELWTRLPVGQPSHLVIHARTVSSVRQQHGDSLRNLSDLDDGEALVFLRRHPPKAPADLFYLRSPNELKQFRKATDSIPAYGVVSSVICADEQWLTDWVDDSVVWLTLIEHSLRAFLTHTCASAKTVRYDVGTMRDGDRTLTFLTFLTTSTEPGGSLYLSICSELAAKACLQFIELGLRDGRFVRDGQPFKTDLAPILTTVVTHLWRDEAFFNSNQLSYS